MKSIDEDLSESGMMFELHRVMKTAGLSVRHPFDIICNLVKTVAKDRYGHEFNCELVEPQRTRAGKISMLAVPQLSQLVPAISGLALQDILQMLSILEGPKIALIDLLDLRELRKSAEALFHGSSGDITTLGNIDLRTTNTPLDQVALLFAALANSNFESPDSRTCPAFLELSMIVTEDYMGESTIQLALTLLLQHICVLRTGTCHRAKGLIAQAVRIGHELGIDRGRGSGNAFQAARFYLLLYFFDLYFAMTYNTVPHIKPGDYEPLVFQPLVETYPRLRRLLDLLSLNGQILYKLYNEEYSYDTVIDLERSIGQVCSRNGRPPSVKWHSEKQFEFRCETIALIHMFWSRIMIRAPLLLSPAHWVTSLSVCLRAAQNLLSIYFSILCPGIRVMAQTATLPANSQRQRQLQGASNLPPTWRQVQRITTSALIVLYAFWHGEVTYDEAGRSCARAVLLLEFRRTRWGSTLDPAQRSIRALAATSEIWLRPFLDEMLSDDGEGYLIRNATDPPSLSSVERDQDRRHQNQDGAYLAQGSPDSILSTTCAYNSVPPPQGTQLQSSAGVSGTEVGVAPSPPVPSTWSDVEMFSDTFNLFCPALFLDLSTSPF